MFLYAAHTTCTTYVNVREEEIVSAVIINHALVNWSRQKKSPLASRLVETWFTRHFTLAGQRRASEKSLPRSSKRTRIKEQESILSSTCLCTLHARELLVLVVKLLVLLRVVSIELPTAVLFYMLMVWLRGL